LTFHQSNETYQLFSPLYRSGLHTCITLLHSTLYPIFIYSPSGVKMLDASFSLFPQEKLTKIIGKPTNTSLQVLKRQIHNNAVSLPSRRGSGAHGHLNIVLNTAQYLVVSSNIPWVPPKHPGDSPNLAPTTTVIQREQVTCQFNSDLVAFELYNRTSNALKQRLLLSVNGSFLLCTRGSYTGIHGNCIIGHPPTPRLNLQYTHSSGIRE
jgi:hypothetical protein